VLPVATRGLDQPYGSYSNQYRFDQVATSPEGWVILDDFFPNLLTGFRIAEYNALLKKWPRLSIHSKLPKFRWHHRRYSELYPELAHRVKKFSNVEVPAASFAYLNFVNNACDFLDFIEIRKTPFVFTLYPGGGFGVNDPECDSKLDRVCASPYLKHVVVTQKLTEKYLRARHPEVPSTLIFGCVVNPLYFREPDTPRAWFGHGKATFDICFVAEKYMAHGRSKGYPVFIDAGRRVAASIPEARLHVVGSYGPDDWPIGELADKVNFHGTFVTQELRAFYAGMDVIVSPNIPFVLHGGHFDGFPTGACAEAALCGVAIVASDVLRLNAGYYEEGREIVVVPPVAEEFAEALLMLARDPGQLRSLALAGQQKSRTLYAPEQQISSRLAVIEREAAACGASL
jgi:lipopolysaccharide transport system ATP-binding protein